MFFLIWATWIWQGVLLLVPLLTFWKINTMLMIGPIMRGPFDLLSQLLPPAMTLWQGNVFTPVCDSVHRGVSVQGASLPGRPPPLYGYMQVVRILLECILVQCVVTACKQSLGQGNIFRSVSLCLVPCSFQKGGLPQGLDRDPPDRDRGLCQEGGLCPRGPCRETPQTVNPSPTVDERAVRILLECCLVLAYFLRPPALYGQIIFQMTDPGVLSLLLLLTSYFGFALHIPKSLIINCGN